MHQDTIDHNRAMQVLRRRVEREDRERRREWRAAAILAVVTVLAAIAGMAWGADGSDLPAGVVSAPPVAAEVPGGRERAFEAHRARQAVARAAERREARIRAWDAAAAGGAGEKADALVRECLRPVLAPRGLDGLSFEEVVAAVEERGGDGAREVVAGLTELRERARHLYATHPEAEARLLMGACRSRGSGRDPPGAPDR